MLKISVSPGHLEPNKETELPPSERKPENSSHDLYPYFPLLEEEEDSDDQVPRLLPKYFEIRSSFAKHGWILTEEDVKEIIPKLKNINKKDYMSVLVKHFREKFPENKDRLLSMTNLERREYLSTALNQYTEKEYYLSITALIPQAEGICKERVTQSIQESIPKQISIFNRRGRKNLLELSKRNLINIPKTEFEILEISRFLDNQSDLPPNFDGLNRHKIAHGDFHLYGTEVNNLKAISLLLWIYDVC